jgi:hypothetical protein
MRKTLILIIIVLLLILFGYVILSETDIGNVSILGITKIKEENDVLDGKISELSNLSTIDYQAALSSISGSTKQYKAAKQEYQDLVDVSSTSSTASAQLETYEIEYLWTKIGNYASKEAVELKLEVATNSTSEATGYYDLNFTVVGSYVGITDFIYDIENDSSLGFKIDNFKMTSETASFTCSDISINIDVDQVTSSSSSDSDEESESDSDSDAEDKDTTSDSSES